LSCFGPSTPNAFAEWVGIRAAETQADWDRIGETLVETEVDGHRAWLHADDLTTLEHPPEPAGVRFLPPYDAYLDQRDRATLIPDTARHRQVWATLGNPGALLVNGEIVGTWRPQKQGTRLTVAISAFGPITRPTRAEIKAEAALLGPIRYCTSVAVTFDA
jgi:hypothetical protein